jgi:hypothetical protein
MPCYPDIRGMGGLEPIFEGINLFKNYERNILTG